MMMEFNNENINYNDLDSFLTTSEFGRKIVYTKTTTSTNDLAKEGKDNPHGTVFVASYQTKGRGRRNRTWISSSCDGLWMSLLLKPSVSPDLISGITLVLGLSIVKALRNSFNADFMIKWPNDIVLNKKKLCGVLCESSIKDLKTEYVVCGVGINLNMSSFEREISDIACSLYTELGINAEHKKVLSEILNHFEPLYNDYIQNGFKNIIDEYKRYCITLNNDVIVSDSNSELLARAVDITNNGDLIVIKDGNEKIISYGDVSIRGMYGYV